MYKKIIVLCLISMLFLCACDSKEVKAAKDAYENGDYSKTVKILSKEKIEDNEVKDILITSEAYVLFDKKSM